MPIDLSAYPFLSRILDETYHNQIAYSYHEDGAHDANWLREYDLFYNRQPNSTPYVRRISFTDLRPVTDASEVSETYLTPPRQLTPSNGVYLKCLGRHREYGRVVTCTPYIMPDSIFGMCIHGSIWISLKILENAGMIEKALTIPEIQTLARGHPYTDKEGLLFKQAARLLRMCRTHAFYVETQAPDLDDNAMLMELYSYVESSLPVIIGVDTRKLPWWATSREEGYHSIVAIGHTMSGNDVDGFVFHDESALPYQVLGMDDLLEAWHSFPDSQVRELLVAVPPQVKLPFTRAYQQFEQMLSILRDREIAEVEADGIRIRPMLVRAWQLMMATPDNRSLVRAFEEMHTDPRRYLWAIYMFD